MIAIQKADERSGGYSAEQLADARIAWYKAASLLERANLSFPKDKLSERTCHERGQHRLEQWKAQIPFDRPPYLAEKLNELGLDEASFLHLLGENPEQLAQRFSYSKVFNEVARSDVGDASWQWLNELDDALALYRRTVPAEIDKTLAEAGLNFSWQQTPKWLTAKFTQSQSFVNAAVEPDRFSLLVPLKFLLYFYVQKWNTGVAQIQGKIKRAPFVSKAMSKSWVRVLVARLLPQLGRTFALELNIARLQGRLDGETLQARYNDFLAQLADLRTAPENPNIVQLLTEYPVLARSLLTTAHYWLQNGLTFLERFVTDWSLLKAKFQPLTADATLIDIEGGSGDQHRGGQSVLLLTFNNGARLVYKPHDLTPDERFGELLDWLNGLKPNSLEAPKPDFLPFKKLKVVNQEGYGWCEFIKAKGCKKQTQIRRFYRRLGGYLALFYAIRGTDFHYENLIAHGEQPVPIDLETLCQPILADSELTATAAPLAGSAMQTALKLSRQSVVQTGLLPGRFFVPAAPLASDKTPGMGVDISGIGGSAGQLSPQPIPHLVNFGTDQMRLARETLPLPGSNNRPALRGKPVEALAYREDLLAGFRAIYRLLLERRAEFEKLVTRLFADVKVRVILRPTRTYARLLGESFHPELLGDGLERDRHFDRLWVACLSQPHLKEAVFWEAQDLWRGDIPYFQVATDSDTVLNWDGRAVGKLCLKSGLESVRERITELSEADLERQSWFIETSFVTTLAGKSWEHNNFRPSKSISEKKVIPPKFSGEQERHIWLDAAVAAGEWLERTAIFDEAANGSAENAKSVTWLNLATSQNGQLWQPAPVGLDLYAGLPGIGLFLAYLGELTDEARFTRLAELTLRSCRELYRAESASDDATIAAQIGAGAYQGVGSHIYFYTHLGILWSRSDLLGEAVNLAQSLRSQIAADDKYDIMAGAAGNILVLLGLYRLTGENSLLEISHEYGRHLVRHAQPQPGGGVAWTSYIPSSQPLAGFSHGVAGIAYSLLELAKATGAEEFRQTALAAIGYERTLFSLKTGNWRDLRDLASPGAASVVSNAELVAWCHGAGGVTLARLASLVKGHLPPTASKMELEEQKFKKEIAAGLETLGKNGFGNNHSLCHGDLGNLEVLALARLYFTASSLGQPKPLLAKLEAAYARAKISILQELQLVLSKSGGTETSMFRTGLPLHAATPGLLTGIAGIGYGCLKQVFGEKVPSVLLLEYPRSA